MLHPGQEDECAAGVPDVNCEASAGGWPEILRLRRPGAVGSDRPPGQGDALGRVERRRRETPDPRHAGVYGKIDGDPQVSDRILVEDGDANTGVRRGGVCGGVDALRIKVGGDRSRPGKLVGEQNAVVDRTRREPDPAAGSTLQGWFYCAGGSRTSVFRLTYGCLLPAPFR